MSYLSKREIANAVWFSQLNRPYLWGGNDPLASFDCSGFVLEGLKSVGIVGNKDDFTADGIAKVLFKNQPNVKELDLRPGDLVFWGQPTITHVEVVFAHLIDPIVPSKHYVYTIGASGGGSKTLTLEDAIKQDAYIKIRPLKFNWTHTRNPFRD